MNRKSRKIKSRKLKSRKVKSRKIRKVKSRKVKSRKVKSRKVKSRKVKSRKVKSRKVKSRKVKSRKVKSRKVKSRKVKSRKSRKVRKYRINKETEEKDINQVIASIRTGTGERQIQRSKIHLPKIQTQKSFEYDNKTFNAFVEKYSKQPDGIRTLEKLKTALLNQIKDEAIRDLIAQRKTYNQIKNREQLRSHPTYRGEYENFQSKPFPYFYYKLETEIRKIRDHPLIRPRGYNEEVARKMAHGARQISRGEYDLPRVLPQSLPMLSLSPLSSDSSGSSVSSPQSNPPGELTIVSP